MFQSLHSLLAIGLKECQVTVHERMARGGHGLPKVSHRPAMPNPSRSCGQATLESAISGVVHLQGGRPAAFFYPFGQPTPMSHTKESE
jgi:hypothetical protein